MPKPSMKPEWQRLESEIIETLLAGHHEWRSDLAYPESHSDMSGAVRGLLRMFEIKRRPIALPMSYFYEEDREDKKPLTYSSSQATNCAVCGENKHTPLRVDRLGGYVCLTCIDAELAKD